MRSGWMRINGSGLEIVSARQDVVDDDRSTSAPGDVPELLGRGVVATADVDRVGFGVVGPADRDHVRSPVRADGCDPGQPALPLEVGELALAEGAQLISPTARRTCPAWSWQWAA